MREQVELLENHADVLTCFRDVRLWFCQFKTIDDDRPTRWLFK